jgi:transcriptional regulator PpsR
VNEHSPFEDAAAVPFRDARRWLGAAGADGLLGELVRLAGDITLLIDQDGTIVDMAGAVRNVRLLEDRIGEPWAESVTVESRPKIEEMLAAPGRSLRPRQVTHLAGDAPFPVSYVLLPLDEGRYVALGRDMRVSAALQQRLIQVQQSLERDYLRLRQAESRYRLLFEATAEPVAIVDAGSRAIREINPAAAELLGLRGGAAAGVALSGEIAEADRETLVAYLGAIAAGASAAPVTVRLRAGGEARVSARLFRQEGSSFFLLRLGAPGTAEPGSPALVDVIERMPDAFVLADRGLEIVAANSAFVELVEAATAEQVRGRPLGDYLGRPGIDLDLILAQLSEHGSARNVATILRAASGAQEEVEVSAVRASQAGADHFGFSLRVVARRLRDLPPADRDLPRSVEQLTELVGRMPLKEIVRESTDLIERLCIEAALAYTSNNRASAAEILGLSRQSLYSKLHRHDLVGGGESGGED